MIGIIDIVRMGSSLFEITVTCSELQAVMDWLANVGNYIVFIGDRSGGSDKFMTWLEPELAVDVGIIWFDYLAYMSIICQYDIKCQIQLFL